MIPRIAVVSSAPNGGAGIAAARLAAALAGSGRMAADFIDIATVGESLPQAVCPADSLSNRRLSDTHFTVEYPGFQRGWFTGMLARYDLINVHWASQLVALAELHTLALAGRPMLFWVHDFHYLTGGCHYPAGCGGFLRDCRACPQIDITRASGALPARALAIKREIFAQPNVHLTAPSGFLRDQAVSAGIVPSDRAHVQRNAYVPLAPAVVRPTAGRVLLIADSLAEGRKRMGLALETLAAVAATLAPGRMLVDVVGHTPDAMRAALVASGVAHVVHGRVGDHARLTGILAQADVVLTCSDEDNWPNVLVEAGCYGARPVVGPGHGCAEFVRSYGLGAVAADYSVPAFAAALRAALADDDPEGRHRAALTIRADHDPERVAARFADLLGSMVPVAA